MFRGINPLTLDAKGRMSIPTKYRDQLRESCQGRLIITIDPDHCLLIYPLPVWEEVEQKLNQLPSTNRRARGLKRLLLGHAEDCALDSQSRILLSAPLRDFARLEKNVVLVGQGNKFELWDEQTWYGLRERMLEAEQDSPGELPAELANLLSF